MRFLAESAEFNYSNDYLAALGERLARADSKDFGVIYALSRSIFGETFEAQRKIMAYSQNVIEIAPNRPEGYSTLALKYWNEWIVSSTKDVNAAHQTIYWTQEYLKREKRPSKKKYIKSAHALIERLNASIAEAGKKKTQKP